MNNVLNIYVDKDILVFIEAFLWLFCFCKLFPKFIDYAGSGTSRWSFYNTKNGRELHIFNKKEYKEKLEEN